jgi:hypothetical protein
VGGCVGVDHPSAAFLSASDSLPVGWSRPEAKGKGTGYGGLLSLVHRSKKAITTNTNRLEHNMFSIRKLSLATFATTAGSVILIMLATPQSAAADSPWDRPGPVVVAEDDSPWDRASSGCEDSPWDCPSTVA